MANIFRFVIALAILVWSTDSFTLTKNHTKFILKGIHFKQDFTELANKWLLNATTPSYFKNFIKLYNEHKLIQKGNPLVEREFMDKILNGVASDSCKVHITEWFTRYSFENLEGLLGKKDAWVLQMIDAWGKLPEGILSGHVNSYGDFDECVGVKVTDLEILNTVYPELNEKAANNFDGQYCTSYILDYISAMSITPKPIDAKLHRTEYEIEQETVSLKEFLERILLQTPSAMVTIPSASTCMPSSCSASDVQQLLVNGLNLIYESSAPALNKEMLPWPVTINCAVKEKPALDAAAITVIVVLGVLITLAVTTGALDYYRNNYCNDVSKNTNGELIFKYLMAFSVYTNTKKLLSTRKSPDDLGCLHGIRFLSTAWVVLAHTYAAFMSAPQWNNFDLPNIYNNWTQLAVINGTFSVDTFFLMSGTLATYSILKMLDRTKGKLNILMFYVHRYIRLTPTYAILVGIGATLVNYAGNGPFWFAVQRGEEYCRNNWWTNLLYINNLVKTKEMCNGESWYLANDMQFYILSPLIVYPIWRWKIVGLLLLAIYTILGAISQVLVVRFSEEAFAMVVTNGMETMKGTTEIYMRPWSRIGVFLIGIWLGWLLHKTRGKRFHLPQLVVAVMWLCSTGIACSVLFGIHSWFSPTKEIPQVAGYLYAGLSRMSWGIAVSWIIFACVKGYGGPVNGFLSWKVFMPLGRLCFCVYLTSLHLQLIFHAGLTVPIKWSTYMVVNIYFSHMVMSYLVGFLCTLLFESPFITLQKLVFEGNGRGEEKSGTMKKLSEEISSSHNDGKSLKDETVDKIMKNV